LYNPGRGRQLGKVDAASKYGTPARNRSNKTEDSVAPSEIPDGATATDCSEQFHISIAWSLNPPEAGTMDLIMRNEAVTTSMEEDLRNMKIEFQAVKIKMGNTINSVELSKRVGGGTKGILG